ncbi:PorV/PorQ family protein [candidate division KSB1 bacterium]|nr:MAG: PorV/PorQ family protein [candidate division KSB1 bacterium]
MKHKLLYLGALVMLAALVPAAAQAQSKVGTTAAPFLNIAVGARALGMGGAFTATADDPSALYWNPAGIAGIERFEASFVHTDWLVDLKYDVVGVILPIKGAGTLGAQTVFLTMPDQEITTTLQSQQDGTGLFFSSGSMAMGLSFARAFTDRFKLGITAKWVREWIWHEDANTIALDLGSIYRTTFHNMRIGVAITNFGGDMSMSGRDLMHYHDADETRSGNNARVLSEWSTDNWPLPMCLRFGLAMEILQNKDHRITTAMDAIHPNDNRESVNLGCEYAFREQFMLRAGYKSLFMPYSEEGLTLGAGVRTKTRGGPGFGLDVAYEDFGRFDAVYKYSIIVSY